MKDNALARRLVGAVVLVALAVIFIPMLLSGEEPGTGVRPVPTAPSEYQALPGPRLQDLPPVPVPAPSQRLPVEREPDAAPAAAQQTAFADEPAPSPEPAADEAAASGEPAKAWVVQVGSFSSRDNALALRDRLRSKRYTAFVEAVAGPSGQVYRVRVGPEVRREDAVALQARVEQELGNKAVVLRHP